MEVKQDPLNTVFVPKSTESSENIPKELFNGVNIVNDLIAGVREQGTQSLIDQLVNWNEQTIYAKDRCTDMLTGQPVDPKSSEYRELEEMTRLSFLAYSQPLYWPHHAVNLHMRSYNFYNTVSQYVRELQMNAHKDFDFLLANEHPFTRQMPDKTPIAGFYMRTPVRLFYRKNRKWQKASRPPKDIKRLNDFKVYGAVNCTVLRKNFVDGTHACYVLWRGTSNHINGEPQYGRKFKKTQIFRFPQYDPVKGKRYPKGSKKVPLFYEHYCNIVDDVYNMVKKCLEALGCWEKKCRGIWVTGHSQGGALTQTYCYMLAFRDPNLWKRCYFRTIASPMCSNDAAVRKLEQMFIDSKQKRKFVEVLNTDDLILAAYHLGGKKGIRGSIKAGSAKLVPFILAKLAENPGDNPQESIAQQENGDLAANIIRIAKTYPDAFASLFSDGAMEFQDQLTVDVKKAATRLGKRPELRSRWGKLGPTFDDRFQLVYCKRNSNWNNLYIGQSHLTYLNETVTPITTVLRQYENDLYDRQVRLGFKGRNEPIFVAFAVKQDKKLFDQFIIDNVWKKKWWCSDPKFK